MSNGWHYEPHNSLARSSFFSRRRNSFLLGIDQRECQPPFGSSFFFFLFPLVVSRCQSEPSKLITPVGSQPKRWEFYRFPPALLYVVCVYIYTGLTDWCQTTRANQRVVEIPPVVYSLYFCFYYFSFFSQKMVHRKISFLFPSSREKVDNSRSSSLFYLETPENITRPRVISQSLVERDTPTANNRSITD